MSYYLLAWNPKRWEWEDIDKMSHDVKMGLPISTRWSCGNSKRIKRGDRVFLIRLGKEPKGIFASGIVTVGSYEGIHWDELKRAKGEKGLFVDVRFDTLLNPETETILPRAILDGPLFSTMHWDTQMSGVAIKDEIVLELEHIWRPLSGIANYTLPEEIHVSSSLIEGSVKCISVNSYERNSEARQKCLDYYGFSCHVCGFNFAETYGKIGEQFIHVHHLKQLSEIGEEYIIDPVRDLRPVCPNCHAMIHRRKSPFSIDEVRSLIKKY